jgi:hypothetical protein
MRTDYMQYPEPSNPRGERELSLSSSKNCGKAKNVDTIEDRQQVQIPKSQLQMLMKYYEKLRQENVGLKK